MSSCCFTLCPDGFTNVEGLCYVVLKELTPKTKWEAGQKCRKTYNANLVSLETQAELDAVTDWIDLSYHELREKMIWVSLIENGTGNWHWINPEDTWVSWRRHEPDDTDLFGRDEDCAVLHFSGMRDVWCSRRDILVYICEHEDLPVITSKLKVPVFGSCRHQGMHGINLLAIITSSFSFFSI